MQDFPFVSRQSLCTWTCNCRNGHRFHFTKYPEMFTFCQWIPFRVEISITKTITLSNAWPSTHTTSDSPRAKSCFNWCSLALCNFFVLEGSVCSRGYLNKTQKMVTGDTELCHMRGLGQESECNENSLDRRLHLEESILFLESEKFHVYAGF